MKEEIEKRNFRNVYKATVVEVLEGNGKDKPYRIVQYLIRNGELIGVVDIAKE